MHSDEIILVTGADLRDRETILQTLGDECHIIASQNVNDALTHLGNTVRLVISEVKSASCNGLDLMRRWKLRNPNTPFLMLVDKHDATTAVDVMKHGADDCLVKPIDVDELRSAALQLTEPKSGRSTFATDREPPGGTSYKSSIDIPPDTSLEELERAAVEQALMQHQGNRTHAARTLGISVRTLQRKLKAWGMPIISLSTTSLNSSFLVGTTAQSHAVGMNVH